MLARLFTRYPSLLERWARSGQFVVNSDVPWAELTKDPGLCRVALVTTAGVHLRSQSPYDMRDSHGDPSSREIPSEANPREIKITHNYYDHEDADRDINVVFPLERLRELASAGLVRDVAPRHFSFMGHILGTHVRTLVESTAPEVAGILKEDGVEAVFLTPA
jgi:D-proline reductase (dithiol) PrdB